MAPSPPLTNLLLFIAAVLFPLAAAQQRNIQTTYPSFRTPAVGVPPIASPSPPPTGQPILPPSSASSSSSSSSTKGSDIAVAVVSTAVSSFAVSGLAFFLFLRHAKKKDLTHAANGRHPAFSGAGGNGKLPERAPKQPPRGGMVDENGLDAIYFLEYDKDGAGGRGRKPTGGRPPQPPPSSSSSSRQQSRAEMA